MFTGLTNKELIPSRVLCRGEKTSLTYIWEAIGCLSNVFPFGIIFVQHVCNWFFKYHLFHSFCIMARILRATAQGRV